MEAIKLRQVTKRVKGFAMEDINLTVPQGLITGFIGPNGSGKSTTIRLIMDIIKPDQGDIFLFGERNTNANVKKRIGFVYDNLYMYADFTLNKIKSFSAPLYPDWDEQRYRKYVDKFRLPERKKIKTFSKGMRMKTSLLFALAHRPELIIMDEPTSGLDPIFRRELLEELQELMVDEKQTIFFSTHMTTDLDQIADEIVFIYGGKIVLQKSMADIRDEYYLVKGTNEQLDADLKKLFLGHKETSQGFTGLMQGKRSLFHGLEEEFMIEPASLEDIMYYMTRKGPEQ